jgi:hypothetical protein
MIVHEWKYGQGRRMANEAAGKIDQGVGKAARFRQVTRRKALQFSGRLFTADPESAMLFHGPHRCRQQHSRKSVIFAHGRISQIFPMRIQLKPMRWNLVPILGTTGFGSRVGNRTYTRWLTQAIY